jgi:hypothetical protein
MKPALTLLLLALLLPALVYRAPAAEPTVEPTTGPAAGPTTEPAAESAAGPQTQPQTRPQVVVSLTVVVEEGERQIRATVRSAEKPVENATVKFLVERSFGELLLGTDKTLDDGTAAVRFPADLPGGPDGELRLIAEVQPQPDAAPVRARTTAPAGTAAPAADGIVPRALWSTRTPLPLACTIAALLAGVWATYAYAAAQLLGIRRDTLRSKGVLP